MRRACRVALQLRLNSACASIAGPSRSIVDHQQQRNTVPVKMSAMDEKLIERGQFYLVPTFEQERDYKKDLHHLHKQLTNNFRVNPEVLMHALLLKLENGDKSLISQLKKDPRLIPTSIRCCGRALSRLPLANKRIITARLWRQIELRDLPISIQSINTLLRVNLDNSEPWDAWEVLKEIENKRGLVPDQETFHLLLENLSLKARIDCMKKMSYEMSRRGFNSSDAVSHSHFVYANEMRGHKKIDEMIKQAAIKFDEEGEALSVGAACLAAATGGRIDRLKELLNVNRNRLTIVSAFGCIWKLSEKRGPNDTETDYVIRKILRKSSKPRGFHRYARREIGNLVSSGHFHTAIVVLEETAKLQDDEVDEYERNETIDQVVGRMCRVMVKSRIDKEKMMEMANRMHATLPLKSHKAYDELLRAVLLLKECDLDERFSLASFFLPVVDPKRKRIHILFPLLARVDNWEDRLKLIYRISSLGYSNLEMLDIALLEEYLLRPMYNQQEWLSRHRQGRKSPLEKMTGILQSYGLSKTSVWRMMMMWRKEKKKKEDKGEKVTRPSANTILQWLNSNFYVDEWPMAAVPLAMTTTRLESAVDRGDSRVVLSLLSTHGWPVDAIDLSSIGARILDLLLTNESSENIIKFLNLLSSETARRKLSEEKENEGRESPLTSTHLLKVISHKLQETRLTNEDLINFATELRRLFPNAACNDNSSVETIAETKRLISSGYIYHREGPDMGKGEMMDIIGLLKTLRHLDFVNLNGDTETVSPLCIKLVLYRYGWNSAVQFWELFQSSLSFGNGMIVLLSRSLMSDLTANTSDRNIHIVNRLAHNSFTPERIHAFNAAALVNAEKMEERAVEYFKEHGKEMLPSDCVITYELLTNFHYPPVNEHFIRAFASLCLEYTPLGVTSSTNNVDKTKKEKMKEKERERTLEAKKMLHTALKFCEGKPLGHLIEEMCQLFARYGIHPDEKEKRRVQSTVEEYEALVDRWIFSPSGLIQARHDDEFIKKDEWIKCLRRVAQHVGEDHTARLS